MKNKISSMIIQDLDDGILSSKELQKEINTLKTIKKKFL